MNEYMQITINALFTGIGVALGTYLTNTHIINKMKKIEDKIKEQEEI